MSPVSILVKLANTMYGKEEVCVNGKMHIHFHLSMALYLQGMNNEQELMSLWTLPSQ